MIFVLYDSRAFDENQLLLVGPAGNIPQSPSLWNAALYAGLISNFLLGTDRDDAYFFENLKNLRASCCRCD